MDIIRNQNANLDLYYTNLVLISGLSSSLDLSQALRIVKNMSLIIKDKETKKEYQVDPWYAQKLENSIKARNWTH